MQGLYIILVILIVVLSIIGYFIYINVKRYQLILKTETSAIAFLNEGLNEIKGRVVALGDQLKSPFSGKDCVYYQFLVEQKKSHGHGSSYVSIINDKKHTIFGVDDGSGIALLDISNAEILLKTDRKVSSGIFNPADENQKSVLEKYQQKSKGFLFEKSLRYTEKFLETGDEIYVIGEVTGRENGKPVFRNSRFPLFISDKAEHELLDQYRLRAILLAGAALLTCILGYLLVSDLF
ncbi:MAG: GIDE domain-containing protein [Bacteroidales bacterium]